ncbi:metalloproteinase inhibitor 4 isoform X4 [Mustela erminea]|uniref:metalloproteinase inhibitor 4 isoform X4 n=1 Tax=Mustela erminea TaxID=36723 RepID=UPI0013873F6D|nr:metalloproteinase inhibitor 4 isoform X4 [Mustela erminea]
MPWSPRTAPSWALLLRLLALLRPPGMVEACSCAPAHPQQHVCHSALAIRAKISSEKVVPASTDPADTQKMIRCLKGLRNSRMFSISIHLLIPPSVV